MSPQFIGAYIAIAGAYVQEQWRLIFKAVDQMDKYCECLQRENIDTKYHVHVPFTIGRSSSWHI